MSPHRLAVESKSKQPKWDLEGTTGHLESPTLIYWLINLMIFINGHIFPVFTTKSGLGFTFYKQFVLKGSEVDAHPHSTPAQTIYWLTLCFTGLYSLVMNSD